MRDTLYRDGRHERATLSRPGIYIRPIRSRRGANESSRSFVRKIAPARREIIITRRVRMRNYYYSMLFSLRARARSLCGTVARENVNRFREQMLKRRERGGSCILSCNSFSPITLFPFFFLAKFIYFFIIIVIGLHY